jgi:hypothetical protein
MHKLFLALTIVVATSIHAGRIAMPANKTMAIQAFSSYLNCLISSLSEQEAQRELGFIQEYLETNREFTTLVSAAETSAIKKMPTKEEKKEESKRITALFQKINHATAQMGVATKILCTGTMSIALEHADILNDLIKIVKAARQKSVMIVPRVLQDSSQLL